MRWSSPRGLLWPHLLIAACVAALPCVSCTDLQLRKYRDPELLREYRYALPEHYVEVDGIRACYVEAGSGPPLLIIPGLGTNADFWQLVMPGLGKDHRVIAVDPPGYGKSDKPDVAYDLVWIEAWLVKFMDRMEIDRADLMGSSLGGHLALMLAMDQPQRVHRLVLSGSCGSWSRTGPLLSFVLNCMYPQVLVVDHMRRNWPKIMDSIILYDDAPVASALVRWQMAVRADGKAFAEEGRAAARMLRSIFFTHLRPRIPEVKQPTLLIWGEFDTIHPLREGRYLREHLPNARIVVVPDSSHQVILDQPGRFTELVGTFFRGGLAAVEETVLDPPVAGQGMVAGATGE